ncbi:MAG: hypothetical protein KF858_00495 [Candidatus Sumerlaeia bacterium]|nr:hypothetical protein [Candidatus Sumerlaeia bacterium]
MTTTSRASIGRAIMGLCLLVWATGCFAPRERSREAFIAHFAGVHRTDRVEVYEVLERDFDTGERRYRLIGAVVERDSGEFLVVWAEVGRVGRVSWLPLEYPAQPTVRVATRELARREAQRLRREFEVTWIGSGS